MGENKNIELTTEQLDVVTGGTGKKGGRQYFTLEDLEKSGISDDCQDIIRETKNASGTKAKAVKRIKASPITDGVLFGIGILEAFVDKYWDLV